MIRDEEDPGQTLKLRRFKRGLTAAHKDVAVWQAFYKLFEETPEDEHDALVAGHKGTLTPQFYEFLQNKVSAVAADEEKQRRAVSMAARIGALHAAFERAHADTEALESAASTFQNLLQARFPMRTRCGECRSGSKAALPTPRLAWLVL